MKNKKRHHNTVYSSLANIMRKLQFTIMIFVLFLSCSDINNNIELNYISSLDYVSRNGIGNSYMDIIKNGWSDHKINFKSKNNTLFAKKLFL